MIRFHAPIVVAAIALSVSVLAQGPRRDGNWEVKMEMDVPGMPQKMPPITMTQCVTKEEAADPQKLMPPQPGGGAPDNCKVSDYKTSGNKVTWSMKCDGADAMSGTGEFVYSENTYDGVMKMNVDHGGQPMAMTMKYSGKRLGDCTK